MTSWITQVRHWFSPRARRIDDSVDRLDEVSKRLEHTVERNEQASDKLQDTLARDPIRNLLNSLRRRHGDTSYYRNGHYGHDDGENRR